MFHGFWARRAQRLGAAVLLVFAASAFAQTVAELKRHTFGPKQAAAAQVPADYTVRVEADGQLIAAPTGKAKPDATPAILISVTPFPDKFKEQSSARAFVRAYAQRKGVGLREVEDRVVASEETAVMQSGIRKQYLVGTPNAYFTIVFIVDDTELADPRAARFERQDLERIVKSLTFN